MTNGGEIIVCALQEQGADTVFTLPGSGILSILQEAARRLRVISGRHETSVVQMAEGWARIRRAPGVAILPEGPGLANGIGGLASAFAERTPLVVLSALPPQAELGRGARQELPQVELCAPICKSSIMVTRPSQIAQALADAFTQARVGVPGPVHLALPLDVIEARGPTSPQAMKPASPAEQENIASPDAIAEVVRLLAGARRPVVVAGSLAYWHRADHLLRAFIEQTGLPLFTVERARGLLPDAHPLCFGDAYATVNHAAALLQHADVVLLLGEPLDCRFAYGRAFGRSRILHLWAKSRPSAMSGENEILRVAGRCDAALESLLLQAASFAWPPRTDWLAALQAAREAHHQMVHRSPTFTRSDAVDYGLHPVEMTRMVAAVLPENALLAFDGGNVSGWARTVLSARRPGDWQLNTVFGQMGPGLSYALGARVAEPQTPVFLITGDGAFGMSIGEIETAVRHDLPVVVIVGNDAAWGIEHHFERVLYPHTPSSIMTLNRTRWDLVAEALGAHGEFVDHVEQLPPALERAVSSGRPACVNVQLRWAPSPLARMFTGILRRERRQVASPGAASNREESA